MTPNHPNVILGSRFLFRPAIPGRALMGSLLIL